MSKDEGFHVTTSQEGTRAKTRCATGALSLSLSQRSGARELCEGSRLTSACLTSLREAFTEEEGERENSFGVTRGEECPSSMH